uniref:DUF2569 family protein n=1 Tax=Yersinia frederiksenii TaxID=29484 RepID=UPI001F4BE739
MKGTIGYYGVVRIFLFKFINEQPIAYLFAIFIIISGLVYIILLYIATICFFKKKKSTKKAMITYYTWSFLFNGSVIMFSWFYLGLKVEITEIGLLISICAGFFVCVPYFLLSKRIPIVFYK